MNTNQIQRFATQARNILLAGVNAKLNLLGFDADGHADAADYPKRYTDSTVFQGRVIPGTRFYDQWMELYNRIILIGRDDVCEEAAYTWFNRLVALRILYKNGIIKPVVEYDNPAVHVPHIVSDARRGKFEYLTPADRQQLDDIMDDDTRLFEQFQILITAYCHNHPILKACFGGITGYTELLLPNNILVDGNFVDLLNNTDYLTEDDYRQSELIGWLYQFYISEKKAQVFASFNDGNKAEADQIPAATQIFTPNWIVKYMVQNTAGRIYLDNHPNSPLKDSWKYLVEAPEPVEGSPSERGQGGVLQLSSLEDLTCADLSCGSGHILGEFFELLYQIYDEELYDPRDAVEKILTHNILGIDLDTRAKQLSMFALLLKACQKDISFADAHCLPRVLDMPKPLLYRAPDVAIGVEANMINYEGYIPTKSFLDKFFSGTASEDTTKRIMQALALMGEAYNLGSIMRFELSPEVRYSITQAVQFWNTKDELPNEVQIIMPSIQLLLALTDKYAAVVMNPPYMKSGNMNDDLFNYVKEQYEKGKTDLFAVFMHVAENHLLPNAKYGMINMQSWMFLSSFEKLRTHVIDDLQIDSMIHLGPRTFDEIGGEVVQNTAYVITNAKPFSSAYYFRLVDFAPSDSKKVNFLNCCRHIRVNGDISKMEINLSPYCFNTTQSNFKKISGTPIGYWLSDCFIKTLEGDTLANLAHPRRTIQCGDVGKFIRLWHEVDHGTIELSTDIFELKQSSKHWFKFSNGGNARRWYGNLDGVLFWGNNGETIKKTGKAIIPNEELYFKQCVGYNRITSDGISARLFPQGILLGDATSMIVPSEQLYYFLALLNSKVTTYSMAVFNPTLAAQTGSLSKVPVVFEDVKEIEELTKNNTDISKQDWDAHETSWDFQENELIRIFKGIHENPFSEASYIKDTPITLEIVEEAYEREWEYKFLQLHKNEEELNRLFIKIYGLQDELSPDVPYEEVTILQGENTVLNTPLSASIEVDENTDYGQRLLIEATKDTHLIGLSWNKDEIISQFISYAIGCYMGRYRLDRPGLHIAHPNPSAEELAPYEVSCSASSSPEFFTIDNDGIIPILPTDSPFPDNAAKRIIEFVRIVFGSNTLTVNMNFVQDALGMSVADYMTKNFYTDHKKRYQNRPIYWLFSSKKGAFQCLVYMHRMNRFTVGRIRDNYLLHYIKHLENKLADFELRAAMLSSDERRELKRTQTALQECREYDNILHQYADRQISIDLDDGVLHNYALFKDILAKLK